jgi:hypothetical protein
MARENNGLYFDHYYFFLVSLKMADLFSLAAPTQMTDASEDFGSILATGLSKKSTGKRKRE